MKNQITSTRNWAKFLATALVASIGFGASAQHPGPGNHHGSGGHHGGHHGPCNAHFKNHRDTVVNGVRFKNHMGSPAATYAWDFGDGNTSSSANPSHVYAAPGTYYVCLTVTDTVGGGCTNTRCDSVRVFTRPPHCNARFRAKADTVANGVRFVAGRSSTGSTYSWDFGDGSTSNVRNPNYTYANSGVYYVCLTVTNSNSAGTCSDTYCDSVDTDNLRTGHHHNPHRLSSESVGIDGISNEAVVSIYPNPMVSTSNIHLENSTGNAVFNLYQMNGRLVHSQVLSNGDNLLSKGNLSDGLYFYSIDDSGTSLSKGKIRIY